MYCCYRDTKMEIQGLSDARNVHSQHGASHRPGLSPHRSTTGPIFRIPSNENESDGLLESLEPQNDNNNNRPGTSPFRLLAENGSMARLSLCKQQHRGKDNSQSEPTFANSGLRNVNTQRETVSISPNISRSVWKHVVDGGDAAMQMAFPFFEGEEEHMQQLHPPGLRQQQNEDGASTQPAALGSFNASPSTTEEFYVVFNLVKEDGNRAPCKETPELLSPNDRIKEDTECSKSNPYDLTEVENTNVYNSNENINQVDAKACVKTERLGNITNNQHAEGETTAVKTKQPVYHEVEGVFSTNEYDDRIDSQFCTVKNEGEGFIQSFIDDNRQFIIQNAGLADTSEAMDTPDFISEPSSLQENTSADTVTTSAPANETFSGTIMINNQSIIVTIENGILTLAAPPEGYVHKDDDMVSLKEHLGMKDHEDIVLLNYDSGTKSIGKISTLAVASSSHRDEPRPGLSAADSEMSLVDDCQLTETSLESCPIIKQEVGTLCAITESDLIVPCPKAINTIECDGNNDPQSVHLIRSKKETAVSFGCPQPGCPSTFDTRQKLKVHLLNHAEDPRPYQCSVEGCGWAFATSYKLKRHLQSHDKQRPHTCQFEGCGRRFTTVYNLKAHVKVHDQESAFVCEVCSERFRSATRLTNHQRVHFEPQRPHKCDFPGCEKTFITFSALFSHNRTHFREAGHFTCSYPGCDKMYDKACRLKIHLRSHTGERPFVCDSEGCGWSFTSMSKLLRHKRKHDDDRRFTCPEEGCGKSFTRAEHLKGHSITHLGTKPFQCHAEGCNAKFSARSSLYIHSKKHKQDPGALRNRCPVSDCSKHFSSRSSLKSHMLKHHQLTADFVSQMETTPTLTPSSELVSSTTTAAPGPCVTGGDQLTNLDLSSLFSSVPGGPAPPAGIGVSTQASGGGGPAGSFSMDLSLVSSGILTIDPSSVAAALGPNHAGAAMAKAVDPLILAAGADMGAHHGLEGTVGDVLPPQGTLNLDDVQSVTPEALGTLAALSMQGSAAGTASTEHALSQPLAGSGALRMEPVTSLAGAPVAELLSPSPSKVVEVGGPDGPGPLLGCVEVLGTQEGGKGLSQFVFPGPGTSSGFSPQKDTELSAASPNTFLESGGSARTDYRAIQMAKKKKQKIPAACSTSSGSGQRKSKGGKTAVAASSLAPSSTRYTEGTTTASGGLTLQDPITGAQYVQIQLLQDDPASDGDLAFQLSSQPSSSHSQLTVDLPVNILQESSVMPEDDNGSDTSQFTGSTINLQDLE